MTKRVHSIVLVPGFLGGTFSLAPLRDELCSRSFDAFYWKRAPIVYRHPLAFYGERLARDALAVRQDTDAPLTLFGWSQGGLVCISALQWLSKEYRNPHDIVGKVMAFGTPFNGTWVAHPAVLFDHLFGLNARELRRGHKTLSGLIEFLHAPRAWRFHAIHGTRDMLVSAKQMELKPEWCHKGPYDHLAPIYDPHLFDLIHRLVVAP